MRHADSGRGAEDKVEVVSVGKMYEEDGAVCVSYEEMSDENETGVVHVVRNLLKVQDNQVEVIKRGASKAIWCLCRSRRPTHIIPLR